MANLPEIDDDFITPPQMVRARADGLIQQEHGGWLPGLMNAGDAHFLHDIIDDIQNINNLIINNDINVINNAGYHFSWSIDIENKIKSFSHQELNDPKTIKKFINYKHVLENCEIVNDLPDFIKLNYSQYFYKHDDL